MISYTSLPSAKGPRTFLMEIGSRLNLSNLLYFCSSCSADQKSQWHRLPEISRLGFMIDLVIYY